MFVVSSIPQNKVLRVCVLLAAIVFLRTKLSRRRVCCFVLNQASGVQEESVLFCVEPSPCGVQEESVCCFVLNQAPVVCRRRVCVVLCWTKPLWCAGEVLFCVEPSPCGVQEKCCFVLNQAPVVCRWRECVLNQAPVVCRRRVLFCVEPSLCGMQRRACCFVLNQASVACREEWVVLCWTKPLWHAEKSELFCVEPSLCGMQRRACCFVLNQASVVCRRRVCWGQKRKRREGKKYLPSSRYCILLFPSAQKGNYVMEDSCWFFKNYCYYFYDVHFLSVSVSFSLIHRWLCVVCRVLKSKY